MKPSHWIRQAACGALVAGLALAGGAVGHGRAQAPTPPADAGRIAFVSTQDGNPELYVMGADGSDLRRLTDTPGPERDAVWSPDGTRIAFVTDTGPGQSALSIVEVGTGEIREVFAPVGRLAHVAWSPDGTRLAFTSNHEGNEEVYTLDLDGGALVNVSNHPANDAWPTFAPDGERIAFQSDRSGDTELYVTDGDGLLRLTESPGADRSPVWSPDGMRIAFISERAGNADLFVVDANGTNLVQLSDSPYDDSDPAWSPDGVYLAYSRGVQPGVREVVTINADGIDEQPRTSAGLQAIQPTWSPDGEWLAFASNRGGTFDIYVLQVGDGDWAALTDLPTSDEVAPRWAALPALAPSESAVPTLLTPPATGAVETEAPPEPATPTPAPTITPPPAQLAASPTPATITEAAAEPMEPTGAPPEFQAQPAETDLLLVYDAAGRWLYLVNATEGPLDLRPLAFEGGGMEVRATIWTAANLSSDLSAFKAAGCLGLWGLGVAMPDPPPECGTRQGWIARDGVEFWTGGSFVVRYEDAPVATCDAATGRCTVDLPG